MAADVPGFQLFHERREICRHGLVVSGGNQCCGRELQKKIDAPRGPAAAGFKSRQRDGRQANPLGEILRLDPNPAPQEFDLGTREPRRLPDDQLCQQLMKLRDRRDLDFLVCVRANPDRHVDELHVAQSRLRVIDRAVLPPLRSTTFRAIPDRWVLIHLFL